MKRTHASASSFSTCTLCWMVTGLLTVMTMAPGAALAQDAPISSDRPGIGNGTSIVAPGTFQAELGYALVQEEQDNFTGTTHDIGQLLLRFGVSDAVELRGGVGSIGVLRGDFVDDSGYGGLNLGAKARLFQNETTTLSALATTSLQNTTTGAFDSRDDRARQDLTLAGNFALGTRLSLTANVGTQFYYVDESATTFSFIPTLNIGLSDAAGAYVGYAGFYNEGANQNFVEGGFTFLPSSNTQLDINTGFRIDDNIDTGFFVGVGLAQRF